MTHPDPSEVERLTAIHREGLENCHWEPCSQCDEAFDRVLAAVRQQARDERDREVLTIVDDTNYSQHSPEMRVREIALQMGYEPCETCEGTGKMPPSRDRRMQAIQTTPGVVTGIDPLRCPTCDGDRWKRSEG